MTVLSSKQILEDNETRDFNAITALVLTHKALSDVSCLSEFKNLERLDLSFNNLTSLEGLKSCVNLKWLSVVQNKVQSLKGIEGLTKLTVLNAGKNKLKTMDEVRSLLSLRALILNDNEIDSICRLDQLKELNTLVLSRNPINKLGESLVKVKSITKLSLSNCQLQAIDSLKSCTELKELRLAHNDIKTLPSELVHSSKLLLLDMGNNLITSWLDLKVLSSLVNLKNLNLQGNPIAEKDKLAKKIRKRVPNLQIFNSRPIDKSAKNEKCDRDDGVHDSALNVDNKQGAQKEEKMDYSMRNKNRKHNVMSQSNDDQHDTARDVDKERGLKHKKQKTMVLPKEKDSDQNENSTITDKKLKKKFKEVQENEVNVVDDETRPTDPSVKKESKRRKDKTTEILKVERVNHKEDSTIIEKEKGRTQCTRLPLRAGSGRGGCRQALPPDFLERLLPSLEPETNRTKAKALTIAPRHEKELKRKSKRVKRNEANVIDDGQTPFADLFAITGENAENSGGSMDEKAVQDVNTFSGLVSFPVKREKTKPWGKGSALQLSAAAEAGLDGLPTWDD